MQNLITVAAANHMYIIVYISTSDFSAEYLNKK
jgi:hypothetical protein